MEDDSEDFSSDHTCPTVSTCSVHDRIIPRDDDDEHQSLPSMRDFSDLPEDDEQAQIPLDDAVPSGCPNLDVEMEEAGLEGTDELSMMDHDGNSKSFEQNCN